jgi:glutamate N-acetyltransferase / amino-acid N-acetyltransferase
MKYTAPPIQAKATLPAGFRAAGITAGLKASGQPDMALFFSDSPAVVAGTFTTNQVKAATVRLDSERVQTLGISHGIVVNSGQANACTGPNGLRDAKAMAAHAAVQLGVAPELLLVCSTGRIGIPLRMDIIQPGIEKLAGALSPTGGESAARGIMTTDTKPKRFTTTFKANGNCCRLTGIAKGSGMIQPCMATMLAFLMTDAQVDRRAMQKALRTAVDKSFNRISVDADQSTNDTVLMLANGRSANAPLKPGKPGWAAFVSALEAITFQLAMAMVRDGEGAGKLITVQVKGARSGADAEAVARSVANSFLVKTSWVGTYPNWGRVMDALGYAPAGINENKVEIHYDTLLAVQQGVKAGASIERLSKVVAKKTFTLTIDLHLGRGEAVVYSCDCTEEYVRINM